MVGSGLESMIMISDDARIGRRLSEGRRTVRTMGFLLSALLFAGGVHGQTPRHSYSPDADRNFPRQVLWGDTHLHSNLSLDANVSGNLSVGPADAYRFARGEAIDVANGMRAKLRRPLDFLVVSDHAEYVGVMDGLRRGDALLLENPTAVRWGKALAAGDLSPMGEFARSLADGKSALDHPAFARTVWHRIVSTADEFNEPGHFSTLIGYEWTSAPGGQNLHRVVIFADGAETVAKVQPFSALDSSDPEKLWAFLARYEQDTGGHALAIPHNGNLSGGAMFTEQNRHGLPITASYARQRARWEPVVEVTQVKGDGETHPFLSPDDEFADYETWDRSDVSLVNPHQDAWFEHEYARSALKLGLRIEAAIGVNPYRFGLLGSTDSHTGLSTADENNYWGKFTGAYPSPDRWQRPMVRADLPYMTYEWQMAASGYAAVWARSNTREEIFAAFQRREVYATTGPRIVVRLFGSWTFESDDVQQPDLAAVGYSGGVPMGGSLGTMPAGAVSPRFLVHAQRDPDGANLDRIQIIKGWREVDGTLREAIYDVAFSANRKVGADGRLEPVGNTVSVKSATYANSIGAPELSAFWNDPDFDPSEGAFYYVRVLEIPTPRWTAYDQQFFGIHMSDEVPQVTQERAYTSPIWYLTDDSTNK